MRWDFEKAVCETLVAYAAGVLTSEVTDSAPVVSYLDTMSQDDGARVIIIAEDGETKLAGQGNATVNVEVGVKTPMAQPTASADTATHFDRVNYVRDIFATADVSGDVAGYNVTGIAVTHIESERRFATEIDRDSGFLYSSLELAVHCHATT